MPKLKIGDRVKCIEADKFLKLNSIYKVSNLLPMYNEVLICIEGQDPRSGWYEKRFELVEPMTKSTPHIHAALIKAWADGAKIQCRDNQNGEWFDSPKPDWYPYMEYRSKPEPDMVRYGRASWIEYDEYSSTERMLNSAQTSSYWAKKKSGSHNIKATFDGETGKLKSVEMV